MAPELEPEDDRSRLVLILTWFLFLVGVFSVLARLGTKYFLNCKLGWDDRILLIGQIVLLSQATVVSWSTSQGLGRHFDDLDADLVMSTLKGKYAITPLLVTSFALIKWSLCAFIHHLSRNAIHRRMDVGLRIMIGIWLLSSVVISIFQCALPYPWDSTRPGSCIDQAWWKYVAVVNAVLEIWTVLLYFLVLQKLQITIWRKINVLVVFSTRLLVVGAILAQLIVSENLDPSLDPTYDLWIPTLLNQGVACLSIVTACAPYLKPFMQSIEPDIVLVDGDSPSEEDYYTGTSRSGGIMLSPLSNLSTGCRTSTRDDRSAVRP